MSPRHKRKQSPGRLWPPSPSHPDLIKHGSASRFARLLPSQSLPHATWEKSGQPAIFSKSKSAPTFNSEVTSHLFNQHSPDPCWPSIPWTQEDKPEKSSGYHLDHPTLLWLKHISSENENQGALKLLMKTNSNPFQSKKDLKCEPIGVLVIKVERMKTVELKG